MKQLIAVLLVMLSIGSAYAQQTAPTPAASSEAVDRLIVVLEDPVLREQLLEHLRSTPNEAAPAAAGAEEADNRASTGLVGALYRWSDELVTSLPTATFGVPIDRKLAQAGTQIGSRVQSGVSSGQLLQFLLWALPGLVIVAGLACAGLRAVWCSRQNRCGSGSWRWG